MIEFLSWISANTFTLIALSCVFLLILVYLIAFFQGRAISFWPPRIEGKPLKILPGGKSSTNVMDAIKTRKSVRAFLNKPVEDEKLKTILEAGRLAPSASNRQEWRFVIVSDPVKKRKLINTASVAFVNKAPIVIVACAETDGHVMMGGQPSYPIDVAIALDHMTLAAVELGLGTCWIGMFDEKKVKDILEIPQKIRVIALLPLGYPANPSAIEKKRLALNKIVKYDHWQ